MNKQIDWIIMDSFQLQIEFPLLNAHAQTGKLNHCMVWLGRIKRDWVKLIVIGNTAGFA